MIVILKKDYGELGNRLHSASNLMAWCLQNNHSLINLSFQDYVKEYRFFRNNPVNILLFKLPFKNILKNQYVIRFMNRLVLSDKWLRLLKLWVYVVDRKDYETTHEQELYNFPKKAVLILRTWDIRCPQSMELQKKTIRKIFTPNKKTITEICKLTEKLPHHDILVGLHARRGDYATWKNGKYYFSWKLYLKWLMQIDSFMNKQNKKAAYIICTNENPPAEVFSKLNPYISSFGATTDLYLLATCNLLLGPPSSFGSWAEFYGNNKRICLNSSNIDLLEFL